MRPYSPKNTSFRLHSRLRAFGMNVRRGGTVLFPQGHDAVCMVDYYLRRYHLFEMYRYFNMNDTVDADRFIKHIAGRVYGEDPTVNHPLLRERFWDWLENGLAALSPEKQQKKAPGVPRLHDNGIHLQN